MKGIVDGCQQSDCALLGGEVHDLFYFYYHFSILKILLVSISALHLIYHVVYSPGVGPKDLALAIGLRIRQP